MAVNNKPSSIVFNNAGSSITDKASALGKLGGRPKAITVANTIGKSVAGYFDPGGSHANKQWNNETKNAFKGSVSKPLNPKRFDISKSGLSATVQHSRVAIKRKGNTRGNA